MRISDWSSDVCSSDLRAGIRRAGIVDGLVRDGGSIAARGIGALHGADDVAALAHAAQRVGKLGREAPVRGSNLRREPESLERLQTAHADRLVERAARCRAGEDIFLGIADPRTVDAGQPVLPDLGAPALPDRAVGSRAEIEVDAFAGPLAQAVGDRQSVV